MGSSFSVPQLKDESLALQAVRRRLQQQGSHQHLSRFCALGTALHCMLSHYTCPSV